MDESWILALRQVPRASAVILGTSRIQAALDPEAFQREFGGAPPVNLALPGNPPLPILEYLADSTNYAGLVVAELLPLYAFDADQDSDERVPGLLDRYHDDRVSPARLTEAWLRVHGMSHLVFRAPELLPNNLVRKLRAGERPRPQNTQLRPDRFGPMNQRRQLGLYRWDPERGYETGQPRVVAERDGKPPTDEEFAALVARMERAVGRIQDRGGHVVLLHMPGCGERRDIEERRFPRSRYWDVLARQTQAIAIAAEDFAELSDFDCWDGSHMDRLDAPTFAAALGRMIRARIASSGSTPRG